MQSDNQANKTIYSQILITASLVRKIIVILKQYVKIEEF